MVLTKYGSWTQAGTALFASFELRGTVDHLERVKH